jgi:rhamnosyltransferase
MKTHPQTMSSAAVIVTYHPDDECLDAIHNMACQGHKIIAVDNTPSLHWRPFPALPSLTVIRLGSNFGLASALNRGIESAASEGYNHIFLLDQDTRVPHRFFEDMIKFKEQVDSTNERCAACVPNFFDRNSKTYAKFPVLSRFVFRHVSCGINHSLFLPDATIAITSGTLIDYSRVKLIGLMKDDYFIDFIDNEFCLRVYRSGFQIAVNFNITIDHAIGQREVHKIIGVAMKPNHHSPERRYYISRNGIRTARTYIREYPSYMILLTARLIHEYLSIVLFEQEKCRKLLASGLGIIHGMMGRMGKCTCNWILSC